jgi:hypothetical protein
MFWVSLIAQFCRPTLGTRQLALEASLKTHQAHVADTEGSTKWHPEGGEGTYDAALMSYSSADAVLLLNVGITRVLHQDPGEEYSPATVDWSEEDTEKIARHLVDRSQCLSWGHLDGQWVRHFGVDAVVHRDVVMAMQETLNTRRCEGRGMGNYCAGQKVPLALDCVLMMSQLRNCGAFHNNRFDVGDSSTLFTGWDPAIDYCME